MNPKISTFFLKLFSYFIKVKPAPLIEGEGSINRIANHCKLNSYNKALIISNSRLLKMENTQSMLQYLTDSKIEVSIYDKVETEPTFALAKNIVQFAEAFNPDVIIALGGGSVIDVAKIVCASLNDPKKDIHKFSGILKIRKSIRPLIAVPTTAGTGSETTFIAVVTDEEQVKRTIISPKIVPNLAVLDSTLIKTLPAKLTAATGIDAFSHAVESYISTCNKKGHDYYAPNAIKLIFENLQKSFEDPENLEYRANMLKASYLAGVSMNNEMVGYAHAFAHQIGALYHIHHGEAIAICLVGVLQFQLASARKNLGKLSYFCGFADKSTDEYMASGIFIDKVDELIKNLKLRQKLVELKRSDYDKIINNAFYETARRYPMSKFMSRDEAVAFLNSLKGKENEGNNTTS